MKKRVGILTSGGDCPGLNATIRGVAKALYARMGENVQIVGILNGYHGLITGEYKEMAQDDFRGILTLETVEDCYSFFEDLCTVKEISDMAQRLEAAKLLETI